MKYRGIASFTVIILVAFLAACSSRLDNNVTAGEIVAPEVSSEDLLVSSLEYLLLDSNASAPDEEIAQEEDAIQGVEAVIYYGDGGSVALKRETIEVVEISSDELIGALAKHNIMSLDTKVLSFEQGEENGAEVLYLDLSKAAGEYLRTMSKEAECIIVAAIADTFLENYGADAIYITVEGETLVTSNAEYTESIVQCTPEELLGIFM